MPKHLKEKNTSTTLGLWAINMNILIIDNNTTYLEQLKSLFSFHKIDVISWKDFSFKKLANYSLIVLSGGHPNSVAHKHELYEEELKTILRAKTPILGICLGFELIVYAFGGRLKEMAHKEKGKVKIEIITDDPVLRGITGLDVYESHRWVAEELPPDLIGLAKSKDGIEIIKHKTRFIYGFQFHPEIIIDKNDLKIFNNLLYLAKA